MSENQTHQTYRAYQVRQMDTSDWRQYHPVLQHRWYLQMAPYSAFNRPVTMTLGESFSNWQSSRK